MSIADFDQKKFIKKVRTFMKKYSISVREFGKLSDISFVTLYRLEQGNNEITLTTIRKLQKAMDNYKPGVIKKKKESFKDLI